MNTIYPILQITPNGVRLTDEFGNLNPTAPEIMLGAGVVVKFDLRDTMVGEDGKLLPYPVERLSDTASCYFAIAMNYGARSGPEYLQFRNVRVTSEDGKTYFNVPISNSGSERLKAALGERETLNLGAEIGGLGVIAPYVAVYCFQFKINVRNRVYFNTGTATIAGDPDYYTAVETEAAINAKVGAVALKETVASGGVIKLTPEYNIYTVSAARELVIDDGDLPTQAAGARFYTRYIGVDSGVVFPWRWRERFAPNPEPTTDKIYEVVGIHGNYTAWVIDDGQPKVSGEARNSDGEVVNVDFTAIDTPISLLKISNGTAVAVAGAEVASATLSVTGGGAIHNGLVLSSGAMVSSATVSGADLAEPLIVGDSTYTWQYAELIASGGGIGSAELEEHGYIRLFNGGVAEFAELCGGTLYAYRGAELGTAFIRDRGLVGISAGQATAIYVYDGGRFYTDSGASVCGCLTYNGGTAHLRSGASCDQASTNGGVIYVSGATTQVASAVETLSGKIYVFGGTVASAWFLGGGDGTLRSGGLMSLYNGSGATIKVSSGATLATRLSILNSKATASGVKYTLASGCVANVLAGGTCEFVG